MRFCCFTFLIFLVGCSEKKITIACEESNEGVDKEFCLMFNNAMMSFQLEDSIAIYSKTYSMIFFEAVTGISSQAYDLHHPYYESPKLLHEDLEKWSEWFEHNKLIWTKKKADSVVLIFSGEKP
jgi:hypothetical protein